MQEVRESKKLYWLEYTDAGPFIISTPFEAVGFHVRSNGWGPGYPDYLLKVILLEIETWRPDIIVFWMDRDPFRRNYEHFFTQEPTEWIAACRLIRENPKLRHTKIIALLGFKESSPEQEAAWRERYDFYARWPLRAIEHARIAKQLVGEEVKGFEGVNYHLRRNGNWKIQDHLLMERLIQGQVQPDAVGQFSSRPHTRLLATDLQGNYEWIVDGIKSETPTHIVYVIRSLREWQQGLSTSEIARLTALAEMSTPDCQLLIGANDILLQTETEIVVRILEQTRQAGGWQVFINEHLWFEGLRVGDVERFCYGKGEVDETSLVAAF